MPKIEIYTTFMCPFCVRAKSLFDKKGAAYVEIPAGRDKAKRAEMNERANGGNTFPQIFIGGKHIGGCDDLMALNARGGLAPLLEG